jgi:hypothetical protein
MDMNLDDDEAAYLAPRHPADPLAKLREELKARGLYRPEAPRRRRQRYSRRCVFVDGTSLKPTDRVLCECRPCQEMKTKSAR